MACFVLSDDSTLGSRQHVSSHFRLIFWAPTNLDIPFCAKEDILPAQRPVCEPYRFEIGQAGKHLFYLVLDYDRDTRAVVVVMTQCLCLGVPVPAVARGRCASRITGFREELLQEYILAGAMVDRCHADSTDFKIHIKSPGERDPDVRSPHGLLPTSVMMCCAHL